MAVYVGPERKAFHLHRDLLCDRSAYFKAAFTGSSKEADAKKLVLPDGDSLAFELFVNWQYGSLLTGPSNDGELQTYFALLALGEKLMLEYLSNQCTDLIRGYYRSTNALVRAQDVSYIYRNIKRQAMRYCIVKLTVLQTLEEKEKGFLPGFRELIAGGGDFAADFSCYLLKYAVLKDRPALGHPTNPQFNCRYHSHDLTPKCKGPAVYSIQPIDEWERRRREHFS